MHKEVGAGGRWLSGKGAGSNSSSLVMSEGFFCSMGVNPHGHLQVLLRRRGIPSCWPPPVCWSTRVGFAQEEGWRPEFMFTAVGGQSGDELVDLGCLPLSV